MKKLNCVISAFPDSYSEYGKLSVSFIESLIKVRGDEWNIKIISNPVPERSMGYLDDHEWLIPHIIDNVAEHPDIWIQCGTPTSYRRHGKLINIGLDINNISDYISSTYIDGMNRMDLMLTISDIYSDNIKETRIQHKNKNGDIVATDKVQIPVETLKLGNNIKIETVNGQLSLSGIKENFCFISNTVWGSGFDYANISQLIYTFLTSFDNVPNKPALILKTNIKAPSILDIERITKRVEQIKMGVSNKNMPNIYLINGNLSDEQTIGLYKNPKVKALLSISSSELSGVEMMEFAITGKPIISPDWGAHIGNSYNTVPIPTEMVDIEKSMISQHTVEGSKFSFPDIGYFTGVLKDVCKNYSKYSKLSPIKKSSEKMKTSLDEILSKYITTTSKSKYSPKRETFEL